MPIQSKNKFDIVNGEIHITKDGWSITGMTTYREDYYEELTSKHGHLQKLTVIQMTKVTC